jgi:hypothetical protein
MCRNLEPDTIAITAEGHVRLRNHFRFDKSDSYVTEYTTQQNKVSYIRAFTMSFLC